MMNTRKFTDAQRAERKRAQDKAWRAMGGDVWSHLKQRCYNPKDKKYRLYGAQGVTVCARWRHSFKNFLSDMGERPGPGYSIDRYPDRTGNYKPGNCRWATDVQQNRNRDFNHDITHNGRTQCVSAWAQEIGVSHSTIGERLRRGWSEHRAVTEDRS